MSRKWINATSKKLDELQNRPLKELNIRAIFIDGKRFHKQGVIIALGVSIEGRKYILGIYQASSEHHQSCLNLLNDLEKRGLSETGLLFIVDGGSGLNKALELKYHVHKKIPELLGFDVTYTIGGTLRKPLETMLTRRKGYSGHSETQKIGEKPKLFLSD